MQKFSQTNDLAVIGLGVMGQGLALNIARNGFVVAGYDQNSMQAKTFVKTRLKNERLFLKQTIIELVDSLKHPSRIFLMVPAGNPVDDILRELQPHLSSGDIIIDCGNSHFRDTEQRQKNFQTSGIQLIGMGVSGGKAGVLAGPCLMAGGDRKAFDAVHPILLKIAAKASEDDTACVAYMGKSGAGHFVKMVHNGIEYAEMQLIAECYDFMHRAMAMTPIKISEVFTEWNSGSEGSFLIGVSAGVLATIDPETQQPLVDIIVDSAGQKGTGRWASLAALDLGVAIPTITAAVDARIMSSRIAERNKASTVFGNPVKMFGTGPEIFLEELRQSLLAARIISFAQGFNLLNEASNIYDYGLDLHSISRAWRAGCILRSPLLTDIAEACAGANDPSNLLTVEPIKSKLSPLIKPLRMVAQTGFEHGIPVPAISSALTYCDSLCSTRLPADLLQGQRDYFGAHGFSRRDKPGIFNGNWKKD